MNKSTGNPVAHDEFIPTNLETSYLHLRTNRATGSGDKTAVWYYNDEEGLYAGGIFIWFTSHPDSEESLRLDSEKKSARAKVGPHVILRY